MLIYGLIEKKINKTLVSVPNYIKLAFGDLAAKVSFIYRNSYNKFGNKQNLSTKLYRQLAFDL